MSKKENSEPSVLYMRLSAGHKLIFMFWKLLYQLSAICVEGIIIEPSQAQLTHMFLTGKYTKFLRVLGYLLTIPRIKGKHKSDPFALFSL